ncbi:hypothetical protein AnigIFM63309_003507 [Aspergillus niger]|nr:hypothetical protein AnigIFM63309_003507 [Aspergillus niger]
MSIRADARPPAPSSNASLASAPTGAKIVYVRPGGQWQSVAGEGGQGAEAEEAEAEEGEEEEDDDEESDNNGDEEWRP